MKRWLLLLALPAAMTLATAAPRPSTAAAKQAIGASTNAILQGDSRRALHALSEVAASDYVGYDAQYRACMFTRFDRHTPPYLAAGIEDAFVRDVLWSYQDYWWRALAAPAQREALERSLLQRLQALLGAPQASDFDALEPLLAERLRSHGLHSLQGKTMPLRELMLWRRQTTRHYDVALPEGKHRARVELLDDFVSRGWSHYARCERGSAGGWATEEMLFAVVPSYREGLDSEAFRVVFLGHETQHFADKHAFPGLASWELEYRAKLAELALADQVSGKRLGGFIESQGDDQDSPHTYANKRVVADLRERFDGELTAVPVGQLQAAARALLADDSLRRRAARP